MIELLLQSPDLEEFRSYLLGGAGEGCVILFTHSVAGSSSPVRLLAHDFVIPPDSAYLRRGVLEAELAPAFVAEVAKKAARSGRGLVFVHSHPGNQPPQFSHTDDRGERVLAEFLERRLPERVHGALVVSAGGLTARELGSSRPIRVIEIGVRRVILFDPGTDEQWATREEHDRQVRALGREGHHALSRLRIGVVGIGGMGSVVVQELAHLGIREYLLIDPDTVEITNLNRLVGAERSDIGTPKATIARANILRIEPEATVEVIVGDVMRVNVARQLSDLDLMFGCTDSHGSRAVLQQIAYQYLIPCIDMGATIIASSGRLSHVYGRIQLLAPGLPCFNCSALLDPNQVRIDMMTELERRSDPYVIGAVEPAPAVISINGTVASLAVTMLLSVVTRFPGDARHLLYNAMKSVLRTVAHSRRSDCFVCSRNGVLARGDSEPIMARRD